MRHPRCICDKWHKSMNSADFVHPQVPSTWRPFAKGACSGCWAGCCTLPVEATVEDLVRLELISAQEALGSLKPVARRLVAQRLVEAFNPRTRQFVLAQVGGRDCVFLDPESRRCTVYEKRPEVCRDFPRIGPRPGYCPQKQY